MEECGGMWGNLYNFASTIHIEYKMRFLGNIEAKVDSKGRVFLPAVFRKVMASSGEEQLILRKDVFESCLVLYPESVWNNQLDLLRSRLSRWNSSEQMLFRQFVSDVETISLDANGRFLISKRYLEMVNISQDVKFIGMDDTIEIWTNDVSKKPFLEPEEFSEALRNVMNPENKSFDE